MASGSTTVKACAIDNVIGVLTMKPFASRAVSVNLLSPITRGVPVMVPLCGSRARPSGRAPSVMVNV